MTNETEVRPTLYKQGGLFGRRVALSLLASVWLVTLALGVAIGDWPRWYSWLLLVGISGMVVVDDYLTRRWLNRTTPPARR